MGIQGRLKEGSLSITGEVNERLPAITNGLVAHYPFDGTVKKYIPSQIRYIRDWLNGSSANTSNHWYEIQAIDFNGFNVALNKSVTTNGTGQSSSDAIIVDGKTTGTYRGYNTGKTYVQIDLESLYALKEIKVWHYHNDGRTYRETKTEVSEDGVNWFTIFDSVIEGEYAETSEGKTHNLQNLGGQPLNTNTTLTNDFIAVEEATTNLASQTLSLYNNYGVPASLTKLNETYQGQPIYRLAMTVTDAKSTYLDNFRNTLHSHGVYIQNMQYLANTKYASSLFWRPVNKHDVKFGGVASNMGGWKDAGNEYLSDGWRRNTRYLDGTMTTNKSDSNFFSFCCPSLKLNETIYIDVCCPQTEQGRIFATSYTPNNRGVGSFKIPFTLKPPYTISLKYTGIKTLSEVINQTDSPMILQMGDYHANASISLWNFRKRLTTYAKGDTGTGWSGSNNYLTYTDEIWNNVEHMYTFVAVDNRNFKIYMDGEYIGNQTSTVDVADINHILLGDSQYNANGRYRDLSIYNRALTDDEIRKLNGQSFNLLENGNINTVEIKESPNGIPKDAIHIPLDLNSKDRLNLLSASEDVNTVYEEGNVWVGVGYNNLISYPEFSDSLSGTNWGCWELSALSFSKGGVAGRNTNIVNITKRVNGATNAVHQAINGLTSGATYTLSFYARINPNSEITNDFVKGYINNYENLAITKEWRRVSVTQVASSASQTIHITQNNCDIQIALVQLQAQPFVSPFVKNSNNASSLEFNLHRDYQLNWNEDWSIVYWKKPVGTVSNSLTGYSIESLGVSGNSVGGGYIWWGKESSSNVFKVNTSTIGTTASPAFNPVNYFNNWQMISIRKSGKDIAISIKNDKIDEYKRVIIPAVDVSNYYVNQYGHDLRLGGYSNSNPTNAYYKDLVIAKRAFTDTELETLYKTQMRATKDGLKIQNSIKENTIL